MLTIALKTRLQKDNIDVSDLPKVNPLKNNSTLEQIVDGINSIHYVLEYYQEIKENK